MEARNDKRKKKKGGRGGTDAASALAFCSKGTDSQKAPNQLGAGRGKSSKGLRDTRRSNRANAGSTSDKGKAGTGSLERSRKKSEDVECLSNDKAHSERPPGRLSNPNSKHVRSHLRKISRCYAYMCHVVRAFGKPTGARTDSFSQRAKAGDKTLLHDCVSRCIRDLEKIANDLDAEIEPTPTEFLPGTDGKIEVLRKRFSKGQKIFSDGDRRHEAADMQGSE